jgi:uncharacterized SAM-binding protein YcdF (DUF218 family)
MSVGFDGCNQSDEQLAQILWDYHYLGQQPKQADVIVALGSDEVRIASYCAQLYKNNIAPVIVFTGNLGNFTRGIFQATEARTFAQLAQKEGVPEAAIILEERSTNTGQNIRFTRQLLADMGKQVASIVVVTKPNTQRRVYATIKKDWSEVDAVVVSPPLTFAMQPTAMRDQQDIINEMVGDIQRMQLYPKLGYQIEQEIPQEVLDAYHELLARGYTEHLMSAAEVAAATLR